ncbi:MAG: DNA adenine methylase [Acidobacteriota bacterium]|nr:DNA adenine methylase [Acidobacteriota bacterium]
MPSTQDSTPGPFRDVKPAKPLAPWLGGKRNLAGRIIERVEAVPHDCYAEPFVGMGGIFLRRSKRPKSEILNDLDGDIVNLFRIVREHPDELDRQFDWAIASRAEFRRLLEVPAETLTDVQRAARFAYLQRLTFGGVPVSMATPGRTGAFTPHGGAKLSAKRMRQLIRGMHERLAGVHVERLEWDEFIRRYDQPFTLFYIDPPYWGHEADYGKGLFSRDEFARMAELLRGLKGHFILSLNDRAEVRKTFDGFAFEKVTTSYSANAKSAKRWVGEVLISDPA